MGDRPVEALPLARRLRVPLTGAGAEQPVPAVKPGQTVQRGQVIARSSRRGLCVHAPVSGRVSNLSLVDTPFACDVLSVVMEPDQDQPSPMVAVSAVDARAPDDLDLEGLLTRLREAGVTATTPTGRGLLDALERRGERTVQHVVVNGMESEPYLTAEYRMLSEHAGLLVGTAGLIKQAVGAHRLWLAVDRANHVLVQQLRGLAKGTPLRVRPLPNKYPQGAVPLLIHRMFGREIPYGQSALDVGVLVVDVTSLWAAAFALSGRPFTSRVVTVAGDAVARPGNLEIPFGTPIEHVVKQVGLNGPIDRAIVGGPMTGLALEDLACVTTPQVGALILLSDEQPVARKPGPCIRCGWCTDDCPVGLDPTSVLDAVEAYHLDADTLAKRCGRGKIDLAERIEDIAVLYPHACLGCGVCSYVCPASLPLAEGLARACALVPPVP